MRDLYYPEISAGAVNVLLDTLELTRLTRIADVGANPLSPPPYRVLLERGGCHLFGFEPQNDAFDTLERNATTYETYFPDAVGSGNAAELRICNDSGLTSLFEPDMAAIRFLGRSRRNIRVLERVQLDTVKLDAIDAIEGLDLLKIDVQGAEVDVFRGARDKLRDCMAVISEVRFFPLYQGEPMVGGIDEELRDQGFALHKFLFLKEKVIPSSQLNRLRRTRHRNQIVDGDAVYVRNMGTPEAYSDEQLMHLAILASAVFESHDLVLYCLDALAERKAAPADLPTRYVDALPAELRKD